MISIEVEEIDDVHEKLNDYPRANGAPLVSDPANPDKRLRYSRPSSYAKPLDDEEALVNWRIDKAIQGVARSPALAAEASAVKDEDKEAKKALRNKALDKGAANESADMGTALHAMTARVEDPDDYFDPPEQYVDDLQAYVRALASYGLVSEYVEVHIVNDGFRAAGTADRIYRTTMPLVDPSGTTWPVGTLFLADIKTGKKLDFSLPGYCVQCAIYADGMFYDVVTATRLPTPEINRVWTLLVHLPVGRGLCEMLWCSVALGLEGAYLAHQVKEWRNAWKAGREGHDAVVVPLPFPIEHVPESSLDEPEDDDLMAVFIFERLAQIGAHPEARVELIRRWPPGLPTPKQGIRPEHYDQLFALFDSVEAKFSLGFIGDPRVITDGRGRRQHNNKGARQ